MSKVFAILKKETGEIINKKIIRLLFDQLKDGKYLIEISGADKRSNPQNRYLHGLLIPEFRKALNSVGYDEVKTDAQAKLIMKSMFLKRQVVNKETGEAIEYIQDTSDCTKEEMNILFDEVIKFTSENMNYQIGYPNEQLMMSYE